MTPLPKQFEDLYELVWNRRGIAEITLIVGYCDNRIGYCDKSLIVTVLTNQNYCIVAKVL